MKLSNREMYFTIRDLGYKPRIEHIRRLSYFEDGKSLTKIRETGEQDEILAKGGMTQCLLEPEDGAPSFFTEPAICCNKDNYNKKIGVHIALARALEFLTHESK